MRRLILLLLLAAASLAGCAGTEVGYRGTISTGYNPDLVYAAPGVQVIADYNEPIFYADNFYWRYYNDRWFRSPRYDRGWSYATPPRVIARIDNPYRYRYYRPQGYVVRGERTYRGAPVYRDRGRPIYRQPIRDRRDRRY